MERKTIKITCVFLVIMLFMPISLKAKEIDDIQPKKETFEQGPDTERWAVLFDVNPVGGFIGEVKNCLVFNGWKADHIKTIYQVTYGDLRSAISWLMQVSDENDIILICSNSHGFNGGIVLYDNYWLYYEEIDWWLDNCKAEAILYSISACQSGSAIPILGEEGRIIMTSCRADEIGSTAYFLVFLYFTYDYVGWWYGYKAPSPNGAFARKDCDINNDGWVSAEEAFPEAVEWTEKFHNEFWNPTNPIHPQIYDGYPGELKITCFKEPPNKPDTPTGKVEGKIGKTYSYSSSTTDPDGDQIYYLFDWGDGNYSDWLGPYNSGEIVEASYTWTKEGNYSIRVKAKDIDGLESEWSDPLIVSMPKTYTCSNILEKIFKWIIQLFRSKFGYSSFSTFF